MGTKDKAIGSGKGARGRGVALSAGLLAELDALAQDNKKTGAAWTAPEERLIELYYSRTTLVGMEKIFKKAGFDRTRGAISCKAGIMGVSNNG